MPKRDVGELYSSAYDRWLIRLALFGPLFLIALNMWQVSLTRWYGDLDQQSFEQQWLEAVPGIVEEVAVAGHQGSVLLAIVDQTCPCTVAALEVLNNAMRASKRTDIQLKTIELSDLNQSNPVWSGVIRAIPSTPSLVAFNQQQVHYVGPVTSGNFCTTEVQSILGLNALNSASGKPVFNWLARGCFCPMPTLASNGRYRQVANYER